MVKAYTHKSVDDVRRSFVASLQVKKTGGSVKQKIGASLRRNLTQVMWAKHEPALASKAYDSAEQWAIIVRGCT